MLAWGSILPISGMEHSAAYSAIKPGASAVSRKSPHDSRRISEESMRT